MYKWHKKFTCEIEADKENSLVGRPKIVDAEEVERVKSVINEDRRQSLREIVAVTGISKSSIIRVLSADLNMPRVCALWISRLWKLKEKKWPVKASESFLLLHETDPSFISRVITADETWLHYFEPEGKRGRVKISPVYGKLQSPPQKKTG